MAEFGNQYSVILFGVGFVVGLIALMRWRRVGWRKTALVVSLSVIVLAGGWLVLRPGASDVNSADAAQAIIEGGKPTFVEFFSNYCLGCVAARPQVDALISEIDAQYADAFNVLRVDIHTDFGRALRQRYGFTYSPEFVLFDATGQAIWRSNTVPTRTEIESVLDGA